MKRIILSFALLTCAFTTKAATNPDKDLLEGICYGNLELVERALNNGANVHQKNNRGWTPLHHAARDGRVKTAYLPLKKGAYPNAINKHDSTPLHTVAQFNEHLGLESALFLLQYCADPYLLNNDGETAYDVAIEHNNHSVAAVIKNCMK